MEGDPHGYPLRYGVTTGELATILKSGPPKHDGPPVFGEDYTDPQWMEAFFSMDLAGNRVLVQLAQSELTVEEQDAAWGGHSLGAVLETAALRPDLR